MKYIPGHSFTAKNKVKEPFVVGSTYRIYHIAPGDEGFNYIFASSSGNIVVNFNSVELAEKVIEKVSK